MLTASDFATVKNEQKRVSGSDPDVASWSGDCYICMLILCYFGLVNSQLQLVNWRSFAFPLVTTFGVIVYNRAMIFDGSSCEVVYNA